MMQRRIDTKTIASHQPCPVSERQVPLAHAELAGTGEADIGSGRGITAEWRDGFAGWGRSLRQTISSGIGIVHNGSSADCIDEPEPIDDRPCVGGLDPYFVTETWGPQKHRVCWNRNDDISADHCRGRYSGGEALVFKQPYFVQHGS